MKLLTVLAFVLVAGAFVGCKYFRGQIVDGPGMEREVDSLETDSVPLADDGKHTVDYIRQRVDGMYACYKNPKYDEAGYRLMTRGNLDSAYCSMRYKALLSQAEEMAGDDDIVLDYDHWTNSQDDNNFTYEVGRIDQRSMARTTGMIIPSCSAFTSNVVTGMSMTSFRLTGKTGKRNISKAISVTG